MQSQGSTSSQPSFDSLSSSDSLLFSDSEQAEDDTDVFLTDSSSSVIVGAVGGAATNGDRGSESPGSRWMCGGFPDEEESYGSENTGKAACVSLDETDPTGQSAKSQGDLLFAQKCAELQGFVRPLLELLNGLKRGRFDRGLSSFQQSVAMDRIQRIVGVLQRPNSGEKYLNTLLQVEMLLKLWFPQISTQPVSAASSVATSPARSFQDTSSATPPHKHRDQLHIPVKKRRLSWTGTDSPTPSPVLLKCAHINSEDKRLKQERDERDGPPSPSLASNASQISPDVAGNSQLNLDTKGKDGDREELGKLPNYKTSQRSEPSLTWVHVAPILSPRKACPSHEGRTAAGNNENQPVAAVLPPRRRGSPAMQDSSISSTTTYKHPKNLKKPVRCQSQPVAAQHSESETIEACQGQSQSPQVTLKPLPRVGPTPLET
ncbi:circadian-associated transcriptional repressor-like isoform X2 [Micropterus dolomieu]|nr:circadian-associated transcriptional repressor-like isoform X2 [Micropterus dolomieu]XP_045900784.1 circadian-associated transcriptional repressor-like isoform X2 [Micropterus dolomieu]XP_045900785.1 circadian-associated transcriptional repressor-like isoform X2 [Micropterus dolomieu]XP_045900786.1 circadian-associated transcriptional repressor-like isoform X2 [Micropterus dolomieu]